MTHNVFVPPKYLVTRKLSGFYAQKAREIALDRRLAALPGRKLAHGFL
jgi:hypothetical protein